MDNNELLAMLNVLRLLKQGARSYDGLRSSGKFKNERILRRALKMLEDDRLIRRIKCLQGYQITKLGESTLKTFIVVVGNE